MTDVRAVFTADEGIAASLHHLGLLKTKRDKLTEAKLETESQIVAAASRAWSVGSISYHELVALYMQYRAVADAGFSKRWDALHSVKSVSIHQASKTMPPGSNESWNGLFPLGQHDPAPPKGVSVVYVLFDGDAEPCYVGSTHRFRNRLKQHFRAGKLFVSWQAFPARDRQAAFELETKFLNAYKPYLNKLGGLAG